ncbi:GNAT family N-acetyltransferase [Cellulomonas sp. Y8]|uniref:GNAT family N-acetyltransferase n=1 Tax=Cellulomonas sp. Y8 TaxID=2591145 RepID=UPI0011C743F3|nr:GNAT family N-acetyltransferase [Cellulomonas sp. Y8]
MTRSTARVLALLERLQAGGIQSVGTLAARLGVDERTVRRYVAQLVEMAVPVEAVRGRHGGYRIAPGYRMPPLMLTDDEALTLLLGLIIGRRGGGLPVDDEAVESAVGKVRRVLPRRTASRLDALLSSADLALLGRSGPSATEAAGGTDPEVLLVLAEAARDRHPVEIRHTRADGTASGRTILPYGVVARSGRWYVTGHESRTGEIRTFRVDRMSNPVTLPGSFHVPGDFDASATVLAGLAATPWRHEVSVRVAGTVEDLRTQLPAGLAALEPTSSAAGPWTRVHLRAERLDWVAPYLAGLGRDLVVEGPAELREHVRVLADRLRAACGDEIADETSPEDRPERRGPRVRIVHLTGAVFDALAAGDLARANACSPVRLTSYFAGPDWRSTWARRGEQARRDPASTAWVTGVIWDEDQSLAAGRAGFHGPPDADGMVEIGYAVDPAHRRRGYARAALEALLQRAREEPSVRTVRVTIAPGNTASLGLAAQYGFTAVGEQWDDEDGLESSTRSLPTPGPRRRSSRTSRWRRWRRGVCVPSSSTWGRPWSTSRGRGASRLGRQG